MNSTLTRAAVKCNTHITAAVIFIHETSDISVKDYLTEERLKKEHILLIILTYFYPKENVYRENVNENANQMHFCIVVLVLLLKLRI